MIDQQEEVNSDKWGNFVSREEFEKFKKIKNISLPFYSFYKNGN